MRAARRLPLLLAALAHPATLLAQQQAERARDTGVSAIWVLANLCYAGMRAQDSPNEVGRALAFLFGLPGTLLTLLVVREGSERAYGVDLPRAVRRPGSDDEPFGAPPEPPLPPEPPAPPLAGR